MFNSYNSVVTVDSVENCMSERNGGIPANSLFQSLPKLLTQNCLKYFGN